MAHEHIAVSTDGHIGTVELRRGPNNHVSVPLIAEIGEALEGFDRDPKIRAVVLCSDGKHFSAGADLVSRGPDGREINVGRRHLYKEAIRLVRTGKPIVAAVHGAAVGAGLGLALVADFRVTCSEARFSANFTRLGFHPGFGLTCTLPRLLGPSKAAMLMYTGRRIPGDEAVRMGLADVLVPLEQVRKAATELATEIAQSGPLAIVATRETLRRGLADEFQKATEREFEEQDWLRRTADYAEGVKAMNERRLPNFVGD
jgi:enoyl-CoA hydratase/carnithine racemase